MFSIMVNTLVPLFGTMGLGFAAGKRAMLPESSATVLNTFVYRFTLPCLIFGSLAGSSAREILQWNFMAGFTLATLMPTAVLILALASYFGWGVV